MNNRKKRSTAFRSKRKKKAGFASSHAVLPTIVTIAAAGVICYFGYSIAKPIVNNNDSIAANGDVSGADDENSGADGTTAPDDSLSAEGSGTTTTAVTNVVVINGETVTTTVTAVTTKANAEKETGDASGESTDDGSISNGTGTSNSGSDSSGNNTSGGSGSDGSGSGNASGNTASSGNGTQSSGGTTVSGAPTPVADVYQTVQCSIRLPESSVSDADSLRAMLKEVKTKYPNAGAVVIPMKLSGGALNFSSTAAGEAAGVVCQGSMTAVEIASIIREAGLYAYASCSLLDDHLYPSVYSYRTASYMIEKDGYLTGDQWLDNYADQGGKPWLDPGSSTATAYLESLVQELSSSGFSAILCSGFTYPNFGPSDEQYLNPDIYAKNPDAMVELANTLSAAVPDTTDIVLDLNAYYTMNGWEPVYQPEELDVSYALLDTSSWDASAAANWAQSNSGDLSVSLSYSDGTGSGHCVINY